LAELKGDLPTLSVRRPYLAIVLNLLIVIAGMGALFGVEVRELPDVDRPIVTVRATYPGGSPETIDAELTSVIEAAVARVNGVKRVRSSSEENNSRVRAEFGPDVDLIDAANDVREAVSRVERDLPEGVEDIFVIKADADASPIIQLAASSESLAVDELTRRVEDEIVPALTAVPGVAQVDLYGAREQVLRVIVDPIKLAGYGLSVADVAAVLKGARYDVPAGSFESGDQEVIVRANASATTSQEIENLIIRDPVRLGEVATASFGPAEAENHTRLDGRTVINLGIVRQAQSNTVAISSQVERLVATLQATYKEIRIETISDEASFIEGAMWEVLQSLALAVLIVVSVIAVFTGQGRTAMIPAVTIPIALIGTIAVVWLFGFSINLVTLLALVLAAGLVVDDAIVVLENVQRLRAQDVPARAAAVLGTRQVFFAVIATTLTLVSVFVPISFLPSTAGRLFSEFGLVLAATVGISSFVALSLCPMIAARIALVEGKNADGPTRAGPHLGHRLTVVYLWLLDRVLAAPLVLIGLCALVAVAGLIVYETLGEELVPQEDRGAIIIRTVGPDGTGIGYADRQVAEVERLLEPLVEDGTIEKVFTIAGRFDPNRGWVELPLADWSERALSEDDIASMLSGPLRGLPGAQARIVRGNSLGLRGADGGLKFALTGSNYSAIAGAADRFVPLMQDAIPELGNLRVEFRATQPQLSVDIDRRRASDLGVSIDDLATTVQILVDKDEVAELSIDDKIVPVILEATPGAVRDPVDLKNLYVPGINGRMVPLSQLVTFREFAVAAELDRHGQRRAIEIDADLAQGFSLRDAVEEISALAARELPPGIGLMFLGEAAELDATSSGTMVTFLIALVVVFLVLTAQFENPVSALIVMVTVPFGVCAAIFALALTGTTINIYSQIGMLMLVGIMSKNSILLVEFADQLREKGYCALAAAREASLVRSRPIIMTMMSTILAGLPLILGSGPGAESRSAIGWVVFGGLGLAGLFTLFLTPAAYALLAPFSRPRSKEQELLIDELAQTDRRESRPPV